MNTIKHTQFLELRDLSVASFLYATGQVELVGKRKISPREVAFQFFPKSKADELVNLYWNLNAPVIQPKKLFSAQRDLKDMIFGG